MNKQPWNLLVLFLIISLVQACALHTVNESVMPPVPIPDQYSSSGSESFPQGWWESFQDETLNQLIESALSDNLNIQIGWARLKQADAIARQAGSRGRLQVNYFNDIQRSRSTFSLGGSRRGNESSQFSQSLAASYEVDLWKQIASQQRAAELDSFSARDDLETIAIGLSASIADAWFSLIEQKALLDLLSRQIEVSQTFLELTEARFGQGMTSAVDVYQQRGQLAAIRSQVPPIESRLKVFRNELAVLLGHMPQESLPDAPRAFPGLAPLPSTGLPADLLVNRPDLRAAQRRVAAADHRIAAAIADRYPVLNLSGRIGLGGNQLDQFFSNWVWALASSIAAPIVDGDRRAAEVDRTRAVVQERLYAYGNVYLNAVKEVENALAQEQQQQEFLKRLRYHIDVMRRTLEETRTRYINGLSDYLPVLTALQTLQAIEQNEIQAQKTLLAFRIQLHRALGGTWPRERLYQAQLGNPQAGDTELTGEHP